MMNMTHDTAGLEAILLDESSVDAFNGSHNITEEPQSMGSSGAFVTIGIAVAGVFFLFVCLASFVRHPENEPWSRTETPVPQQRRKLKPEEMKLLFIIIELMITTRKVVAIVPANEGGDDIEESNENEANHTRLLAEDDEEDVYIHLTYPMKKNEKKITRRSVKDFENAESGGTTIHAPHLMSDINSGDHQDPSTTLTSTIIPHDETETTDDDDSSDSGDDDSSSLSVPDGTDDNGDLDLVGLERQQEQQEHQETKVEDDRDTSLVSDPFTTPQVQEGVSSSLSVPDGTDDNLIGLETKHHQELEERDLSPVTDHLSTPRVEKQEHVDQHSSPEVDEEQQQEQQVEHHPAPQVDGEQKQVQAEEQQQEEEQQEARVEEPQSFLEQHEECTIHQQEAAQQNISQEPHCVLCFEKYSVGEEVCFSCDPECIHVFHKDCIVEWLARSPNCPCCKRQYLDINLAQLGGGGEDTETEQSSQTEDDDES